MKRTFITYLLCILFISMASGRATTRANQPGSIVKQSAPLAQVGAQQASLVEVENWTKPQPGWLYVLDPRPNVGEIGGHIWLLDPESGKVMGAFILATILILPFRRTEATSISHRKRTYTGPNSPWSIHPAAKFSAAKRFKDA